MYVVKILTAVLVTLGQGHTATKKWEGGHAVSMQPKEQLLFKAQAEYGQLKITLIGITDISNSTRYIYFFVYFEIYVIELEDSFKRVDIYLIELTISVFRIRYTYKCINDTCNSR